MTKERAEREIVPGFRPDADCCCVNLSHREPWLCQHMLTDEQFRAELEALTTERYSHEQSG